MTNGGDGILQLNRVGAPNNDFGSSVAMPAAGPSAELLADFFKSADGGSVTVQVRCR